MRATRRLAKTSHPPRAGRGRPGAIICLVLVCCTASACGQRPSNRPNRALGVDGRVERLVSDSGFAGLIARISEEGGFFDTDNLISNERSYLHAMGALAANQVRGGVYIGVGPGQNFSYIAEIRPELAFVIDIRRDNVLQHLMFKALFEASQNRLAYLALLVGAPFPSRMGDWDEASIEQIVAYADTVGHDSAAVRQARALVLKAIPEFGWPLAATDLATVARFHDQFVRARLDLRFRSHNRPPRPHYPTLRDLLLERDLEGRRMAYLADEDDFQFLKRLQREDRIVPVIGDLAGNHALREMGRLVAARGGVVSALYTSNVEFYLWRAGTFGQFAQNVLALPTDEQSVIIRSVFGGLFGGLRQSVPGYRSTQLVQTMHSFKADVARNEYRGYWDLVTRRAVPR